LPSGHEDKARHVDALATSPRNKAAEEFLIRGRKEDTRRKQRKHLRAQAQLGFSFDSEPPKERSGIWCDKCGYQPCDCFKIKTEERVEICDPPEIEVEPEQPALFEGFAPVSKNPEPEIPWTQYIRMAQLFFDQKQFEEFQGRVSKLAVRFGTKNLTETVAEALRRAEN
jgi:hypothetical protein